MQALTIRVASVFIAALTVTAVSTNTAWAETDEPTPNPSSSVSATPVPENPEDWEPPADWEVPDESANNPLPSAAPDPSEGDLVVPPTKGPKPGVTAVPNRDPDCVAHWKVMDARKFPARMGKVGPYFSSFFGNGGTQTLTAGISGTLTATASAKIEGGLSIVSIVSAKAEGSASLAASATVSASLAETQPVPKGYWGNAFWGGSMMPISFKSNYYGAGNCKLLEHKEYTVWYPFQPAKTVGWCKWVSKSSLGSRPSQCNANGHLRF